uniref:Uncharacterized protein n=1 Tax=Anguilla anguilla TaxID=7936 RepID=A0A0E9V3N9_ANGAN
MSHLIPRYFWESIIYWYDVAGGR